MMEYFYSFNDNLTRVKESFDSLGFVGFCDLLSAKDIQTILRAIDEAVINGKLVLGDKEMKNNQNIIFVDLSNRASL